MRNRALMPDCSRAGRNTTRRQFDQLPEHEKQKDRLFLAIVRALTPEANALDKA